MSDGQRVEMLLPCKLTAEEERNKGKVLAHVFSEYRDTQDKKKTAASAFKEMETAHLEEMEVLKEIIKSGFEERMVVCVWVYDWAKGKRSLVRQDTRELVDTQAIPADEHQTDLGLS